MNKIFLRFKNLLSNNYFFVKGYIEKLLLNPLLKRIIKGTSWILIGNILSKVILLASSIIVARLLGHSRYGEFGILRSTINSFSMLASMGLGITATKYIAENLNKNKKDIGEVVGFTFLFSLVFTLIISIFLFLFSNRIADFINSPQLYNELRLSVFVLFFLIINGVQIGVLAGFEKFSVIAKGTIFSSVISFFVQIIGAYFYGIYGVIIGLGINYFFLFFYYTYGIFFLSKKHDIVISVNNFKKYKNIFFKMSLPAALSGLLVSPIFWYCSTLVVKQRGGYGEMAIIDATNQLQQILLFIPTALTQLALPIFSSYNDNKEKFKQTFNINLMINICTVLLLTLLVIVFSSNIMKMYGEYFNKGNIVLVVMTISTLPMVISNLVGQTLIAKNKVWIGLLFNMIWGITLVLLSYYFIKEKKLGANGYSYSYLLSYIMLMLANIIYYKIAIKKNGFI